jgi:hypothetical protein
MTCTGCLPVAAWAFSSPSEPAFTSRAVVTFGGSGMGPGLGPLRSLALERAESTQ